MARYWLGTAPSRCDVNGEDLNKIGVFMDGATKIGPWAKMCPRCFQNMGFGLGPGRGQKYVKQDDGKWLKTEG